MNINRKHSDWRVLITHTIHGHLHRYTCDNCGSVWDTVRHYEWNCCPMCCIKAVVRGKFDD